MIVHRQAVIALFAANPANAIIDRRHRLVILAFLVDGVGKSPLEIAYCPRIIGQIFACKVTGLGQPSHIGGIQQDALIQVIGCRVVFVLQLEFLIEMVTVLGDVFLGCLGAGFAFFQPLLPLGKLGSLGSLDGLGLVYRCYTVLDVTFGPQQRVGFGESPLQDTVADAHVELIHQVVI